MILLNGLPASVKKVLVAVLHFILPESKTEKFSECHEALLRDAPLIIGEMQGFQRWGFFIGIKLFSLLPFLFGFGFKKFSSLSDDKQFHYIDKWSKSDVSFFRDLWKGMSSIVIMIAFSQKSVWNEIGYFPDEHMEERINLRRKLMEG